MGRDPGIGRSVAARAGAVACLALLGGLSCNGNASQSACLSSDAAGPALVTPAAELGGQACATYGTPDATLVVPFQIDTGGNFVGQPTAYDVGGDYGQPACPDQYLVGLDISASIAAGKDIFVNGGWSVVMPPTPCGYSATTTIWGSADGATWLKFDQMTVQGQSEPLGDGGTLCHAFVTNRLIQTTLGGTWIPASDFTSIRVAVVASDCGSKLPIDLIADN